MKNKDHSTILSFARRWGWLLKQLKHLLHIPADRIPPKYDCNLCGFHGYFQPTGFPIRDGQCPSCHSLERHRLFDLWLKENEAKIRGRRILHFAPEQVISKNLTTYSDQYITADVEAHLAEVVLNIEAIELDDESYDVVVCFHVLEHVDDRAALRELHRILAPGGTLLIMIPIIEGWKTTFEDASITDIKDRELYFGQSDHVRYYGADFRQRVEAANFALAEFTSVEPFVSRNCLLRGEKLFVATKAK